MFQDYKVDYLRRNVKIRQAVPQSFLRQTVSYMLSLSAKQIPHAAGVCTFDVTNLVEYGRDIEKPEEMSEKELFKRALTRNFSAFFLKTIAHGLAEVPCLNGFLDYAPWRNASTLYQAEDINMSFTVHTRLGVLKPIVRNPHLKTLETVAHEMQDLARKARRTDPDLLYRKAAKRYIYSALRQLDIKALPGLWMLILDSLFPRTKPDPKSSNISEDQQLSVDDIMGATCTLANVGMMATGNQTMTVIIPPEVTMFGLGDLHLAPVVYNGEITARWVITLCATMDHRAYDAGEAFPFQQELKKYLDNPSLIYDWKPESESSPDASSQE